MKLINLGTSEAPRMVNPQYVAGVWAYPPNPEKTTVQLGNGESMLTIEDSLENVLKKLGHRIQNKAESL